MFTTYFAKLKQDFPKDIVPIAICGKSPQGYKGLEYKKLAPKYWFFKEWKLNKDNEFYIKNFRKEVLEVLNPEKVVKELCDMAGVLQDKIALVCYEKSTDFCHRHLVAEWLNNAGFCVYEYDNTQKEE